MAEQGLEGAPESSFLPLYYSTLNFMKVYLLILGKREELEKNRWHGAKYFEKEMSRQFLNEKVFIGSKGTIPLIYNAITDKKIGKSGVLFTLKEIYQSISSIEAEYRTVTKTKPNLLLHSTEIIEDNRNGHYLKVFIADKELQKDPPSPRQLKAYSGLKKIKDKNGSHHYESRKLNCDFELAKKNFIKQRAKKFIE